MDRIQDQYAWFGLLKNDMIAEIAAKWFDVR